MQRSESISDNFLFILFPFQAYQMRDAGAVIHSHGIESCLATMINPSAKEFRVSFHFMAFIHKGESCYF